MSSSSDDEDDEEDARAGEYGGDVELRERGGAGGLLGGS